MGRRMDCSHRSCGKEKSLPIPPQQFFCAEIPIRQNYFKKEKGKQTRKEKRKEGSTKKSGKMEQIPRNEREREREREKEKKEMDG